MVPGTSVLFSPKFCHDNGSDWTEEYSASELALIFYTEQFPSAFLMALDLDLPAALAFYVQPSCSESSLIVPSGSDCFPLRSLIGKAAYSV